MTPEPAPARAPSDLPRRLASALVLGAAVLAATWQGGMVLGIVWAAAAIAVWVEWRRLHGVRDPRGLAVGVAGVALAADAALTGRLVLVLVYGLATMGLAAALGRNRAGALAGGVAYAMLAVLPVLLLRRDGALGLVAALYLYAVVWGSDTLAYATGRTLGGPKLWPRLSPKKTWSGFVGGTVGGGLLAALAAGLAGLDHLPVLFVVGVFAAVASQGGDLYESALKRRAGVKDSGSLIPGHGGVMDRLDGFIAAGAVLAAVGLLRDAAHPATGLLVW